MATPTHQSYHFQPGLSQDKCLLVKLKFVFTPTPSILVFLLVPRYAPTQYSRLGCGQPHKTYFTTESLFNGTCIKHHSNIKTITAVITPLLPTPESSTYRKSYDGVLNVPMSYLPGRYLGPESHYNRPAATQKTKRLPPQRTKLSFI